MYSFISRLEQFRVSFCFGMIRSVGEKRKEIDCGQKERGYERRGRGRVLRSSRSLSSSPHKKCLRWRARVQSRIRRPRERPRQRRVRESAARVVAHAVPSSPRSPEADSCVELPQPNAGETPSSSQSAGTPVSCGSILSRGGIFLGVASRWSVVH